MPQLPADTPKNNGDTDDKSGNQTLNIGSYHYHGNDLKELAKISKSNPELANKLVDNSDKYDQRSNFSYRFGIAATLILVAMILAAFVTLFVLKGTLVTFAIIGCFSVVALLTRVILTGKWSDDSVVGKALLHLAKALGSSD